MERVPAVDGEDDALRILELGMVDRWQGASKFGRNVG
jgi:hypothetical protein